MWLSDRRTLLAGIAAAGLLAGCGFTPVYAPDGVGTAIQGQILPVEPRTIEAYAFVDRFEERLGRNDAAPLELQYKIQTKSDGLAITPDESTLRYHLTGTVAFAVVNRNNGRELTNGEVSNFTSYSAIGTTVATRASEKDAEERLMVLLADQVVAQLIATSKSWLP